MRHIEFKLRNLKIKSDQPQNLRFVLLISKNVTAKGGEGEGEGAKGEWPLLYKHFLHSHFLPYRTGLTYAFYKGVIMKTYLELLLESNRV